MNVRIEPIREVVIHELTVRNFDDFVDIYVRDSENPPIWCNGYIMMPYLFPDTSDIIINERILNDRVHYKEFVIAPMQKYKKRIKRSDMGFEQEVIDMSGDKFFIQLLENLIK